MSCLIMGVHLDEPTSTVNHRWSTQSGTPLQKQWTEEDLDAFVRQLSNPQHHVTKMAAAGSQSRTDVKPSAQSPRKSSLDLGLADGNSKTGGRRPKRAPLSRSETDTAVHFGDLRESSVAPVTAKPESSRSGGLISGLSGLRLIKNKKLTRSSHTTAKKCLAQKSIKDEGACSSPSTNPAFMSVDVEDPTSNSEVFKDAPVFGPSSPEESDGETDRKASTSSTSAAAAAVAAKDASSNGAVFKEKKRRFRKMLSRPLKRSQSAGCAKDVSSHALFMDAERRKSKEAEMASLRKERASEGDIRHSPTSDEDQEELEGSRTQHGGDVQKSKSRNIAHKISKHIQFLRRRHTDSTIGMMDKEESRRLSDLDPSHVQSWSRSFESLLYDKNGLELFRGFLVSEHSDENIEFWIACQNYKTVKSHKQLAPMATRIYNDYVAVQARREINLDSKTRTLTQENVASNPNRQTFDEAQKRVQALMEKDSYRRFLESELYQDLASGALHHK